jgi:transcription antitermination factor NusG
VICKDDGLAWYVLATVPRGEIKCVRALRALGYEAYSPVETRWIQHSRTAPGVKREVQTAIFCRYVFFAMAPGLSWLPLREKDAFGRNKLGIIGVISIDGAPCAVPVSPLIQLADEERAGWFDERRRPELERASRSVRAEPPVKQGERVRILSGAFASHSATADEDTRKDGSVAVLLDLFGRSTVVVLPIADLENVDRPIQTRTADLQRA